MAKKRRKPNDEEVKEITEAPPSEQADEETELEAAEEREALEQERAELQEERRRWEAKIRAAQLLQERRLPVEFAPYFAPVDEEQLEGAVNAFETLFREAVTQAVVERLRGRGIPKEPKQASGYSRGELKHLSAKEINSHWEEIMKALQG